MITKRIRYYIAAGLLSCSLTAALTACSDTWDDHYEGTTESVHEGSLWQAIKQNSHLSNFASVLEACGYDKTLASSQVFTVFAPTNDYLSAEEAAKLIAAYNAEKKSVSEEDNSVVKEFVRNHIAMYNHSVSPSTKDTLVMMNGKYASIASDRIGGAVFDASQKNQLYQNGLLFVINGKVDYEPNVFEYLRKDAELDSLSSFFYDSHFYRKEFEPSLSVPGGFKDGKTVYLDSVFSQVDEIFGFISANLSREDSTYWMVAPTNQVWKQLIEQYEPYFNYDDQVEKRDSLVYTNPRLAIVNGTVFSRTFNTDASIQDSAFSTSAVRTSYRQSFWGNPRWHYYQYGDYLPQNLQKPLLAGGVFNGTRNVECSNGVVMKADQWNFNPLNTFDQILVVSATGRGNIQEVGQIWDKKRQEWVDGCDPVTRTTQTGTPYYGWLFNNSFVEFKPGKENISVTFNLRNVLSNHGYDIYLVTPPALAVDSNATVIERLPTRLECTLYYHNQQGERDSTIISEKVTTPDVIDYVLLAEDFKFPCSNYGLEEEKPQTQLKVATCVDELDLLFDDYTRTMYIAYILLVPHGMALADDQNFYYSPHGDGITYYMSKCNSTNLQEEQ